MNWKRSIFISLLLCGYSSAQLSQNTIIIMPRTDLSATGKLIFRDASGAAKTVTINDPLALTNSYTLTLPLDKGTSGQALVISSLVGSVAQLGWGASGSLPISGGGLTLEGTVPQIDGSLLGANSNTPLELKGSSTVDGRILLVPGAVSGAGNSRVVAAGVELDDPALAVVEGTTGSVTNGTGVFQIMDSSGNVHLQVLYGADTNSGALIVGGTTGPFHGYVALNPSGVNPVLDGRGLASNGPLTVQGSTTVDGRIVLTPGSVSGANKSRVSISGQQADDPALVVVAGNVGTPTNGNGVFQIQDNGGTTHFQILYPGDAHPNAAIFGGDADPGLNLTYNLGSSSSNRWNKLWVGDIDFSGSINPLPDPNNTILFARMTGGTLALTTAYQDLPSATVTLTNGTWLITACLAWATQGGDGSNEGQLVVNGVAQTGISAMTVTATGAVAITAVQQWVVTNSSGSVTAKLQAKNTGPTVTNADVFDTTTTISASLMHL